MVYFPLVLIFCQRWDKGFGLGSLSVRGEYEVYDVDDADVSMLSLGLVYQFD